MNGTDSNDHTLLPPRKILVAIDGAPPAQQALAYVHDLVSPDAEILLVSVAENPHTLVPTPKLVGAALEAARDELLQDASDALEQAREAFADLNVTLHATLIDLGKRGGDVAHALADTAQTWGADLLVVGSRQIHGLQRWVEGAVSEPVAKLTQCPLLIVPAGYHHEAGRTPRRILFAVDGSDRALRAVRYGAHFATLDAQLRAIYVVDRAVRLTDFIPIHLLAEAFVTEGDAALTAAQTVLANAPGKTTTALVNTERTADDVAHTIVREAVHWDADLLVMGTHGRRGLARWFVGSIAGRVARITQTPLLLVCAPKKP
jgi:nucleotide-binding universal stress UspA family protein